MSATVFSLKIIVDTGAGVWFINHAGNDPRCSNHRRF